jgi:hypothetical protein
MRPKRIVLLFLVLVVLAGVSVGAPPRVKFTQSPVKIAVFTWCSSGVCVPLTYRWQGSVRVEYDYVCCGVESMSYWDGCDDERIRQMG